MAPDSSSAVAVRAAKLMGRRKVVSELTARAAARNILRGTSGSGRPLGVVAGVVANHDGKVLSAALLLEVGAQTLRCRECKRVRWRAATTKSSAAFTGGAASAAGRVRRGAAPSLVHSRKLWHSLLAKEIGWGSRVDCAVCTWDACMTVRSFMQAQPAPMAARSPGTGVEGE